MDQYLAFASAHWSLCLLFFALLIMAAQRSEATKGWSPDELVIKLNEGQITLVDIRPKDDYLRAHISGALSRPLLEDHKTKGLKKDQTIVLIGDASHQLLKIKKIYEQAGFCVQTLAGGLQAWRSEGLPTVRQESV